MSLDLTNFQRVIYSLEKNIKVYELTLFKSNSQFFRDALALVNYH